jgi:hypothetical protein
MKEYEEEGKTYVPSDSEVEMGAPWHDMEDS